MHTGPTHVRVYMRIIVFLLLLLCIQLSLKKHFLIQKEQMTDIKGRRHNRREKRPKETTKWDVTEARVRIQLHISKGGIIGVKRRLV